MNPQLVTISTRYNSTKSLASVADEIPLGGLVLEVKLSSRIEDPTPPNSFEEHVINMLGRAIPSEPSLILALRLDNRVVSARLQSGTIRIMTCRSEEEGRQVLTRLAELVPSLVFDLNTSQATTLSLSRKTNN